MRWLDEADMEQQSDATKQVNDEKTADNVKVEPVDQQSDNDPQKDREEGNSIKNEPSLEDKKEIPKQQHAWFISRGAEMCDVSEGLCTCI